MASMLVPDLELPLDPLGFSLRICPSCGAAFKARATRRDAQVVAAALADRIPHMERAELAPALAARHCPYCAATHAAAEWWTDEQRQWLDAHARCLADEIRWRWMQLPFDRLGQNPRPTYVSVPPSAPPEPTPEENGEELVAVPLPCCGEELRISDAWAGSIRCHYCGLVHARRAVRDFGLELAQLRAWHAGVRSP